ncbi:MAG: hypothetical protein Tsb0015_11720 [Simkaniaceae bacterium]
MNLLTLPKEMLGEILTCTSPATVCRFSFVSRKAREVSGENRIWRFFCERIMEKKFFDIKDNAKACFQECQWLNNILRDASQQTDKKLLQQAQEILMKPFSHVNEECVAQIFVKVVQKLSPAVRLNPRFPLLQDELSPFYHVKISSNPSKSFGRYNIQRHNTIRDGWEIRQWRKEVLTKNDSLIFDYLKKKENKEKLWKNLKGFSETLS